MVDLAGCTMGEEVMEEFLVLLAIQMIVLLAETIVRHAIQHLRTAIAPL